MRYFPWILVVVLLCTLQAFSHQTSPNQKGSDLTWEELKRQQNAERTDFISTQKDSLSKALDVQKQANDNFLHASARDGSSQDKMIELHRMQSQERILLLKGQEDERTKEAEIWAGERKAFKEGK